MSQEYGVWITESDGSKGRWMTENRSHPWRGTLEDAIFYANQRQNYWAGLGLRYSPMPVQGVSNEEASIRGLDQEVQTDPEERLDP